MAETRRKSDEDFRQGAVRIVWETSSPMAQVARELGQSTHARRAEQLDRMCARTSGRAQRGEDESNTRIRRATRGPQTTALQSHHRSHEAQHTRTGRAPDSQTASQSSRHHESFTERARNTNQCPRAQPCGSGLPSRTEEVTCSGPVSPTKSQGQPWPFVPRGRGVTRCVTSRRRQSGYSEACPLKVESGSR
jgi:transposase